MSRCDMCGKETILSVALVEGTELNVCSDCGKFGKILRKIIPNFIQKKKTTKITQEPEEDEIEERIIQDYNKKIKEAREKSNLKQEDFAKQINEKTSLIHNIESGHKEPSIKTALKMEKFLNIKLIEEIKLEKTNLEHKSSEAMTIGDLIKSSKPFKK